MDILQFNDLLPGKWYELALFIYILINNAKKKFDIGKEIKFADKWDDLVVKFVENNQNFHIFFQIKLIDNRDDKDNFINSEVLLGKRKISLKIDDFKLQKYLISYLRIKDQLNSRNDKNKIQKLIVFTNAHLDLKELSKTVSPISCSKNDKNDLIPNTNNGMTCYKLREIKNSFLQQIIKDVKSDFDALAEKLASYANSTAEKKETMTLDKDYFAYYHTALIDEKIIEIKIVQEGNKQIKRGKFTLFFLHGKGLSIRAQKLRNKIILKKKMDDVKTILQNMKTTEWTVSEDFDLRKTEDVIFLPNYDIKIKDIRDFFGVLEFRSSQLGVKDLLSRVKNVEIQKTFSEYYDTDPKLIEFLINVFILGWKSNKTIPEKWISSSERSKFVTELLSKISKPKAIYRTQEHVKYLKNITEKFGLYYHDDCLFHANFFSNGVNIVKTASVILSSAKMIKSLEHSKQNNYIFIDMEHLLHRREIIKLIDAFRNDDFNLFILSCKVLADDDNIIIELMEIFREIIKKNKQKQIIFITVICNDSFFKNMKELRYKEHVDKAITLRHLVDVSKILDQRITLQDQLIKLSDFIDKHEIHRDLLGTEIIERFINNKHIKIGNKPLGTSYLQGAYTEIVEEVNIEAVIGELRSNKSDHFYVISCVSKTDKEFIQYLIDGVTVTSTDPNFDETKNQMRFLDNQDILYQINTRVQVTNYLFTEEDFKEICHFNSERRIYWFKFNHIDNVPKFILLQIYNPNFYLKGERFNTEVVIARDIKVVLTSFDLFETFVISGKSQDEVVRWLQLSDERIQFRENCKDNKIRILASRENDIETFQEIVQQKSNSTIHLLTFKKDQLCWCLTHGSFKTMVSYRARDHRNTKSLINEDSLVKEVQDKKVVIIAGDPGMGKSSTLVKLYESKYGPCLEDSIIKTHLLFRINLKTDLKGINDIDYESWDVKTVTEAIANILLRSNRNQNNDFARNLLVMAMHKENCKKPILIALDGFDEVLDESDRSNIISLLKYLKNKTEVKTWTTTRHHYENTLENSLTTFDIIIEQMNTYKIREFIKKYLKNNLSLRLNPELYDALFSSGISNVTNTKVDVYTNMFLDRMQKIFRGDIRKFIGTPLQLYLMLENSAKHFIDWLKNDCNETLDFTYLGSDLWSVYENFINRKYDTYFRKVNIEGRLNQKQDKVNFEDYHKCLASLMKIPKDFLFQSKIKENLVEFKDKILLAGIVRSQGGDIEYIHPTFAEYFVAKELISWVNEWKLENVTKYTIFEKQKYLLEEILLKSDFQVVRAFLSARLLKENNENVLLKSEFYNQEILFVAAEENNEGIAGFILDNLQEVSACVRRHYKNNYGHNIDSVRSVLETAAEFGNLDMVQFLINRGVALKDQAVLHFAVTSCNLDLIKYLVEKGADVNHKDRLGKPVLHMSTSLEVVEFLVKKGADVNAKTDNGITTLQILIDKYDICKFLIETGANVNAVRSNGTSVLHSAVKSENFEVVRLLIENGANINAKDVDGKSVLHTAAKCTNLEVVKLLVAKGSDVKARNNVGWSVLHFACRGSLDIFNYFVHLKININTKDSYGRTILHHAVEAYRLDIVKFILDHNIVNDVNVTDRKGWTALHDAFFFGHKDIISYLLTTQNVDMDLKDGEGRTAVQVAKLRNHQFSMEYINVRGETCRISTPYPQNDQFCFFYPN